MCNDQTCYNDKFDLSVQLETRNSWIIDIPMHFLNTRRGYALRNTMTEYFLNMRAEYGSLTGKNFNEYSKR